MANAYAKAGVDVKAGYEVVERIKKHTQATYRQGVMGTLGSFGGCFDLSEYNLKEPVLVSGTDGVGTKLMVAIQANQHRTIGIDCVAMCVNDIVAQGAEPLYFLDYLATGKVRPAVLEDVIAGVANGCVQAGCALIGGETAEMPGMYAKGDYDVAGFAVGLAEKSELVTGENIKTGDVLIGLPSSGIHSNGYSLVRKIFFEMNDFKLSDVLLEFDGQTLQEVLLEPTRIYAKQILPLVRKKLLNGMAHITGGGFLENIPRMLPQGLAAQINLGSWESLPIFYALEKYGHIDSLEMYEIFNMGIGMVLAVSSEELSAVAELLEAENQPFFTIGKVVTQTTQQQVILIEEQI